MNKNFHITLLISAIGVFIWSLYKPVEILPWCLEAVLIVSASFILIKTYKNFTFTNMAYLLIWIHIVAALVGAHYTYAKVPIFNWLKTVLGLKRNYYDRFVHTIHGFVCAIVVREFFIRKNILNKKKWTSIIVICLCLTISCFYELGEFLVAKIFGNVQSFLALQGDIWDTQWDLTCALTGSLCSLLFNKYHNKSIKKLYKDS